MKNEIRVIVSPLTGVLLFTAIVSGFFYLKKSVEAYDFATDKINAIESYQQDKVIQTGFYTQIKTGIIDPNTEIWVYEDPQKNIGYQIIEYGQDYISSTGYGSEAKERTWIQAEWRDPKANKFIYDEKTDIIIDNL